MRWGSWASKVVDLVNFGFERIDDVVPHQLEMRMANEMGNILFPASEVVVQTKDIVPFIEEPITEMTAQKSSSTSDENSHSGAAYAQTRYGQHFAFLTRQIPVANNRTACRLRVPRASQICCRSLWALPLMATSCSPGGTQQT